MTSKEIIDGVITSINAQIARRIATAKKLQKEASNARDAEMFRTQNAVITALERVQKDLIQVEMNAKISYMGINTEGGEE